MKYEELANIYEKLSSTTKRLEKTEILSNFLKKIPTEESEIIYLIQGNIYPEYDERKIGISEQLAIKAIAKSFGTTTEKIIQEWKKLGDIGEVAQKICETKKQATLFQSIPLTTKKVLENLKKLPELIGNGTENKKISLITELLISSKPIEAKFITRTLTKDMRIGVQESTIKNAILKAFFEDNKENEPIIQRAIDISNDLAHVFQISKDKDISELKKMELEVGNPIRAMLAQKVSSAEDALKQLGAPLAVEYKYDGFRMLIHKKNDEVTLFTRRLENVTNQFPEIKEYVKQYISADSFILDTEAVGYDKITKKYTDFQAISQRIRRKHKISELQEKLPVELVVFDILFLNGESQIEKTFEQRSETLRKIIQPQAFKIIPSHMIITSDTKEINDFYTQALKDNQEGVMLKKITAEYNPGRRVGQMLKMKPEEKDFDLVITGGEWGTGKRSGWISSFNLACQKDGKYLEIGKVGTGISEKEEDGKVTFDQLTKLLKPLIKKENGKNITVDPKIIVAVTYQDIQKSTNYSSGWALRFPRITTLREDKPLIEIATEEEIEETYYKEKNKKFNANY